MHIVLDTNVWVSGLLWRGAPWHVVQLVEDGRITVYVSVAILDELRRVLHYPRLQPRLRTMSQTADDLVAAIVRLTIVIEPPVIEPVITADHKDDMFLACALAAGAQYLVSGDHHLLDLGQWRGMQIVTVNKFLQREFAGNNQNPSQ